MVQRHASPAHGPIVLAFLDVDYQASLDDCIRNLWPHLTDRGYVFIDEYVLTDYCALFWSERYWRTHFDATPPGLIGAGSGVGVGQYYLGPFEEWNWGTEVPQSPTSVAYTRKDFSGYWGYYPDSEQPERSETHDDATGCSIADRELLAERSPDLLARERRAPALAQSGQPLAPGEHPRPKHRPQHPLLTRAALPHLADDLAVLDPRRMPSISSATRFASSRSRSGLRSHGSTISAMARAHGASRCHTTPTPKNAGTIAIRTPSWLPAKSSIAVRTPLPGPPSLSATHSYRRPASATPASSGEGRVVRERLAVLFGNAVGGVVNIPAAVRPARRGRSTTAVHAEARSPTSRSSRLTV